MTGGYDSLRAAMVEMQIVRRGIVDARVLAAMRKVPRHEFVPDDLRGEAYHDNPLPIGAGQTISQPYMVALMTECLGLKGPERVLEIGTGSGYQAAIIAELSSEVLSVERVPDLADAARGTLERLGYRNVTVIIGDGTLGFPDRAPYDRIIVTAGAPAVPVSLTGQLADGGRLVIPVGGAFGQSLSVVERRGDDILVSQVCGCTFVPLIGKEGWQDRYEQ